MESSAGSGRSILRHPLLWIAVAIVIVAVAALFISKAVGSSGSGNVHLHPNGSSKVTGPHRPGA
jgi:hypothetical protein